MIRSSLIAVFVCASGLHAQSLLTVQHHLLVREVDTVTGEPVPHPNGMLEPGESAQFFLSVSFSPPVGTKVTEPPWPTPLSVHALRGVIVHLLGMPAAAIGGTWSDLQLAPDWNASSGPPGIPRPYGVEYITPAQHASGAHQSNPVIDVWQGTWTPSDYTDRAVTFTTWPAGAAGPSQGGQLWIKDAGPPEQFYWSFAYANITMVQIALSVNPPTCYPNCDGSTVKPILNIDDFTCFINEFAQGTTMPHPQQVGHYANCDGSTTAPVLNIDDFTCFINAFAKGCQ